MKVAKGKTNALNALNVFNAGNGTTKLTYITPITHIICIASITYILSSSLCAFVLDGITRWSALSHVIGAGVTNKKAVARAVALVLGARLFALLWLLELVCSVPKGGIRGVNGRTLLKWSRICTSVHVVALPTKVTTKTWWSGNALRKTEQRIALYAGAALCLYALIELYALVFSWRGQVVFVAWSISLPGPFFRNLKKS
jgi:hypothetical protein